MGGAQMSFRPRRTSILYYAVLLVTSIVNVSWENTHTELQLRVSRLMRA